MLGRGLTHLKEELFDAACKRKMQYLNTHNLTSHKGSVCLRWVGCGIDADTGYWLQFAKAQERVACSE